MIKADTNPPPPFSGPTPTRAGQPLVGPAKKVKPESDARLCDNSFEPPASCCCTMCATCGCMQGEAQHIHPFTDSLTNSDDDGDDEGNGGAQAAGATKRRGGGRAAAGRNTHLSPIPLRLAGV